MPFTLQNRAAQPSAHGFQHCYSAEKRRQISVLLLPRFRALGSGLLLLQVVPALSALAASWYEHNSRLQAPNSVFRPFSLSQTQTGPSRDALRLGIAIIAIITSGAARIARKDLRRGLASRIGRMPGWEAPWLEARLEAAKIS